MTIPDYPVRGHAPANPADGYAVTVAAATRARDLATFMDDRHTGAAAAYRRAARKYDTARDAYAAALACRMSAERALADADAAMRDASDALDVPPPASTPDTAPEAEPTPAVDRPCPVCARDDCGHCARPHCGHPVTAHTAPDASGVCRRCNPRALHACHAYIAPRKDDPR